MQDISTLNRMDYAANMFARERVDVSLLVCDMANETVLAFSDRHMTFCNCLPQSIIVRGNE